MNAPTNREDNIFVIEAAGGNATAIMVIDNLQERSWYEINGTQLMKETEKFGVEQAGFLIPSADHYEMSGGEFCGNAARSAALILSRIKQQNEFSFTMSGCLYPVEAEVEFDGDKANVKCTFKGLPSDVTEVQVLQGRTAKLIDLGGIAHVLIEGEFPKDDYEKKHRQVCQELGLLNHDAVGVDWFQRFDNGVHLDPVVWVRAIDSFFYETACGSGTIAVFLATGIKEVEQPSKKIIRVEKVADKLSLESTMEVTNGSFGVLNQAGQGGV